VLSVNVADGEFGEPSTKQLLVEAAAECVKLRRQGGLFALLLELEQRTELCEQNAEHAAVCM
jgi:hypothetical protein